MPDAVGPAGFTLLTALGHDDADQADLANLASLVPSTEN
jgi:hypothetical protein